MEYHTVGMNRQNKTIATYKLSEITEIANVCIIKVPEGEERKVLKMYLKMMAENPNLKKK